MDPNATLREISGARKGVRLNELCTALCRWINGGGFPPDWSEWPHGARKFNTWCDDEFSN